MESVLKEELPYQKTDTISPDTNTPAPANEYRTLNDGEIVMDGDEFWNEDRRWVPATSIGQKVTSYTHKIFRRPLTETSSQIIDTCPDCSSIPCHCEIPAGYTPTPRTDFAIKASNGQWNFVLKLCSERLERELTAAREELDKWEQIAHDKLSEVCRQIEKTRVVTEQLTVAREELNTAREDQAYMNKDLNIVTEQRDRLAEAMEQLMTYSVNSYGEDQHERHVWREAKEALQSLKTDHTVEANDMISAVKGGNYES